MSRACTDQLFAIFFLRKLNLNLVLMGFGIAGYKSELKIQKLKIAN